MNKRHQELLDRTGKQSLATGKANSAHKLTIGVFLPQSPWGSIDETAMEKGLGGRETALVHLALAWAKLGHDVYAFVPRDDIDILDHPSGGCVRWIPNRMTLDITNAVQPDLFVSWEDLDVLARLANTYYGITAVEMQVAHLNEHPEVAASEVTDYVCVLSQWAGEFIRKQHPDIEKAACPVFANGIDISRFPEEAVTAIDNKEMGEDWRRLKYKFIYSSSPDRGLHHLLKMWPGIRDSVQSEYGAEAELHVCYGIENFIEHSRWSHREDGQRALIIEELIEQPGVIYHGKIGQSELAQLMIECDLMLYPADTISPTETGCISIVEALAAGTPVVTTDCDCIGPDYHKVTEQVPLPLDYQQYIIAVLDALEPEYYLSLQKDGIEFAKKRDWDVIAQQWIDYFTTRVLELRKAQRDNA